MIVDPGFTNEIRIENQNVVPNSNQLMNPQNVYDFDNLSSDIGFLNNHPFVSPDSNSNHGDYISPTNVLSEGNSFIPSISVSPGDGSFAPPLNVSPGGESSSDDNEYQETVLKFISQILMEENMEEQPCMFYDPLGLHSTEKSFYDVLGKKYTYPTNHQPLCTHQIVETPPDANFSGSSSDYSGGGNSSSTATSTSTGQLLGEIGRHNPSLSQTLLHGDYSFKFNSKPNSQLSAPSTDILGNGFLSPSVDELLAQNICSGSDSILQFKKGLEEASKFLPKGNPLIDLESSAFSPEPGETTKGVVKEEKPERAGSPNGSKGRKNHEREDTDLEEERRSKQSAVYVEEGDLSEMFDKVLLCTEGDNESSLCVNIEAQQNASIKALESNGSGGRSRAKKQGRKKETVDLRTLLILCAQAVSSDDQRTANELLKQIRQHSSPLGDGSQRLAHCFANGLEARLAGTGMGIKTFFSSLLSKKTSAAELLKAYHLHLSACPFKKISMFFSIKNILKVAQEATTLHVVDFGILYGFQWPMLIQQLAQRSGGPPKLRITGIEFPQPGFRPAGSLEESGRRLAKYCQRFGVPFEFNAIASQHWETIQLEELKIKSNEVLAVHCSLRFKNLLDETVEVNCRRNAVLNLIRKMNPNIFVHSIVNGSYNAPFFVTRFREALFHFSALFDMFDINISRENEERMMFEKEFYGREAMNVIACEGLERVERPETYKQWQVRNMRAGFKSLPLNQELMKKFKEKFKACYHKDFLIDEDNNWMLQGWKGRIVYASSCWVPAEEFCS